MLTATEYHMREPVPLHLVQAAILDFCSSRRDVVVFGAQAVNVYTAEPRMSQDVDMLSPKPREAAEALRAILAKRLHIAARVREVARGKGFRIYQARKEHPRHLADVRLLEFAIDDAFVRDGVRYVPLPVLAAMKVRALASRRLTPKGATDLADIRRLILAHPELRVPPAVADAIRRVGGGDEAFVEWNALLAAEVIADEDEDGY